MKTFNILNFFFITLLGLIIAAPVLAQQEVDIKDISSQYNNKQITVEGVVDRHKDDTTDAGFYYLKGRFGGEIMIRTGETKPAVGDRVTVTGIYTRGNQEYYLDERARNIEQSSSGSSSLFTFAFIGLTVIALALGYLYFNSGGNGGNGGTDGGKGGGGSNGVIPPPYEDKTVKINRAGDATIKLARSYFQALEGLSVQTLKFYVDPDRPETVYTFGRNESNSIYHIQFKSPAVSRSQAKLVFRENMYTLYNYSQSNPTEINGKQMNVNESYRLKNADIIQMGDVKFKFIS